MPGSAPRPRRWPHVALGLYVAAALFSLNWPGLDWLANRVEPRVLGLPFFIAWIAAWAIGSCLALGAYLALTERPEDR
jgi:hypothetical protein